MLKQKSENSIVLKSTPISSVQEDYRNNREEMIEKLEDYILSLHGRNENTKDLYLSQVRVFSRFLLKRRIKRFEDVTRKDIDLFLAGYPNESTKDNYVVRLRHFYGEFLKIPDLIEHLKLSKYDIQPVVPSELLTPEEIVKLANEASKRREMYKVIILTLFESCARISEVLSSRLGDVVFSSVVDKEGKRKLVATLYFKRSKGGVRKQPVTIVMFSQELKRWVDNCQAKKDSLSWLFPSPYNRNEPVGHDAVSIALWNSAQRLGIKKRTNPHWLRHSGLSFFANHFNYSETLLQWRAGWRSTQMARRYIHSGAELEGKAYLERMGYVTQEEKPTLIKPKTCPHCNALNPYTNNNCDFCAMSLDLEEYKREIEKRRNVESLYQNLEKIYTGKLSEGQKAEISKHSEVIAHLSELGREDLVSQYITKLLETWTRVFLST